MHHRLAVAALATCLFLAVGCENHPTFTPELTDRFDAALAATHDAQGAIGTVMLVAHDDGRLWSGSLGVADRDTGRPILADPADQPIRSASVGKTFVGALVLALHEEGALDVDDPVSRYVDFVPNGDVVTLRMLLQHTSGIPNYTRVAAYNETLAADPSYRFTYRELVELCVAEPFDFEPGTGWNYSNTGYILLGFIVEGLVGRPVEDELQARFFGPLGMTRTQVYPSEGLPDLWTGYVRVGGALEPVVPWLGYAADGGAWVTTLGDLRTWAQAFFGGRLHRPETLALAQLSAGGGLLDDVARAFGFESGGYGTGLVVAHDATLGPLLAGAGNGNGARTFVGYLPDVGVTFAVAVDVGDGSVPIVETLSASGPLIETLRALGTEGALAR